jgi:hypothetical protein
MTMKQLSFDTQVNRHEQIHTCLVRPEVVMNFPAKILTALMLCLIAISSVSAQEDFVPKFDGTKYYLLIYDGDQNEKVLSYKPGSPWNAAISYSDYFTGANSQLWVFEEPDQHPGFINVRNLDESLSDKHFLKSWSWNAYLEPQTGAREGDQERDLELVFRFKHVFDGWQALETIEKPAGLYGVEYTPGPDALNIDAQGVASFSGVKTSSITSENAAMKVFKLVEFDPLALFLDAIERGRGCMMRIRIFRKSFCMLYSLYLSMPGPPGSLELMPKCWPISL